MFNNIIVAPDSFKGTMEATEICQIISTAIKQFRPGATVRCIPMADGGEGMVSAYVNLLGGAKKHLTVRGPLGKQVVCEYGVLDDGTYILEMASCAGLSLTQKQADPLHATTFGVGQILKHVEESGAKHVIMGIGGSGTNDLGLGMAAALGYRFLDAGGQALEPMPVNFSRIDHIRRPDTLPQLNVVVACDVDNPLCGPSGATYTFGPQKGIPAEMLPKLDAQLNRLADIIERDIGPAVKEMPGAGAAGGMGAALVAFMGAQLKSGVELLLDSVGFDEMLREADLVLTGEGRIDWQSVSGKVPVGVARRARARGVPCIALCGAVGPGAEEVYQHGVTAVFPSIRDLSDFDTLAKNSRENIRFLTNSVLRVLAMHSEATAEEPIPLQADRVQL